MNRPQPLYQRSWRSLPSRDLRFDARTLRSYFEAALPEGLSIRAAADEPSMFEIMLYDEIGYWGVTALNFSLALAQVPADASIRLRINSPGGDVFDGLAIHNSLKARTAPVTCVVDGLAASAASFIACAGSSLEMADASMLMIHNAWGGVVGDKNDMAAMAAVMGKIDGQLAAIYAAKSGKTAADIAAMMDAETWFTAEEALEAGLCDKITEPPKTQARLVRTPKAQAARETLRNTARISAQQLPDYDPDGDGDNDAEEALGHIRAAAHLMTAAMASLTGNDGGDDGAEANASRAPKEPIDTRVRNAATEPEWQVGASSDLPIDADMAWDGPEAAERMLEAAGFNGNSPDPAKAKAGFLVWDHHNPKLKGSYKLPFADIVGGELKALKSGLDAAASRLPQTDIPTAVKARARDVLDAYEKRAGDAAKSQAQARIRAEQRRRRLRIAEADNA